MKTLATRQAELDSEGESDEHHPTLPAKSGYTNRKGASAAKRRVKQELDEGSD